MRPLTDRQIAIRLFLTCWLIYSLHFATNIVREIYPALALGDHFSFRVDDYANMHPDLFEKEGYGWHIGNNPGASMLAAIPYALARPLIDKVVEKVLRGRMESGASEPPVYDSPWPMAQAFYAEAWKRGYDIKFGLAAFVMQAFLMAPGSALGVLAVFFALRSFLSRRTTAIWLALLYALGTPVFFRTGFLNHNLMLGHITFLGFITLWNPAGRLPWSDRLRYFLAGVAGGTAVLFDYSGVIMLVGLFAYGLFRRVGEFSIRDGIVTGTWYVLGTLGPMVLLWLYQWKSFGHPFMPGQHWMPPVEWIELGYQGFGWPQLELFFLLGFDHRFGLFVTGPVFLFALAAPIIIHRSKGTLPSLELYFCLGLTLALWVFFSGSNYTRLQFNTGIRYLAPIFPFLFLAAAVVIYRLRPLAAYYVSALSIFLSWSLAMHRSVESELGMLEPVVQVFSNGLSLPALATASRMQMFAAYFEGGVSPIPLFLAAAVILYGIWSPRFWGGRLAENAASHQHPPNS